MQKWFTECSITFHWHLKPSLIPLYKILEAVVKCISSVKAEDLDSRLFQQLCRDMDAEHETLLFLSKVRQLSKSNVVNLVFELRGELKLFLEMKGKTDLLIHFQKVCGSHVLPTRQTYLSNKRGWTTSLHDKDRNVFHLMERIRVFFVKLQNWQRKSLQMLLYLRIL